MVAMEKISTLISIFLKNTKKKILFMANGVPPTVLITYKYNKRQVTLFNFRQICFSINQNIVLKTISNVMGN